MGEETSVLNWHPKTALGHLRADKQLLTVFLHTEEDDSRFLDLSHQIKCFFFGARAQKGIARHIYGNRVVWSLIDNGKLADHIARLAEI